MAVNKVVNKQSKSHGAMRNVIEYVLRDDKIKEGFVDITGPYTPEKIDWDSVYQSFLHEKRLWGKDSGRMYAHNIISFHKDEVITPDECLEIGRTFANKFFPEHQSLIGVHQDREHLHVHIVTNSVSYIDGRKLHQTKRDLEKQKTFTNILCKERGLSVTEKGKRFNGTALEEGEFHTWSKDKYHLLLNESRKSYIVDCAIALMKCVPDSSSKEEFIQSMARHGWIVHWNENRKHIVFENQRGERVRDSNISKTFTMNIGKEALTNEFERQNDLRKGRIRPEYDAYEFAGYYAEAESALSGIDITEAVRDHTKTAESDPDALIREFSPQGQDQGRGRDDCLPEQLHTAVTSGNRRVHGRVEYPDISKPVGRAENHAGTALQNNSSQESRSRKRRDHQISERTAQNAVRSRISTDGKCTSENRERETSAARAKRKRRGHSR